MVRAAEDFVPGFVLPAQLSGGGIERVEHGVTRTQENRVLEHEGRGFDAALGFEGPKLFSGREVERMDDAVVIPNENASARDGRGGFDRFSGGKGPREIGFRGRGHRRAALHLRTAAAHGPVVGAREPSEHGENKNWQAGSLHHKGASARHQKQRGSQAKTSS